MFRRIFLATAVASSFAFSALADGHSKDIVDTAVDAGSFTTLAATLEAAGLIDALKGTDRLPYLPQPMTLSLLCPQARLKCY